MSRRATGVAFCAIAALLYAARYLAAAIWGSGVSSWSRELFESLLQYVGAPLVTLSLLALAAGVAYLAWAEHEAWTGRG
ncbi:MAG: hypothetical protein RDU89_05305 [bacterium]|nr:hypothetical protein [bacterium]